MIVVLPVCEKDSHLALKNLAWLKKLGQQPQFECLVSSEIQFDQAPIRLAAEPLFTAVHSFTYDRWEGDTSWPQPQNWAWQRLARHMPSFGQPWLWWEADAVPIEKDWLSVLWQQYRAGEKPFAGHIVEDQHKYMAGVGIYPPRIADFSNRSLRARASAFDIVLGDDIYPLLVTRLNEPIAHIPSAKPISFSDSEDIDRRIPKGTVLFHPCKDGSLIDLLSGSSVPIETPTCRESDSVSIEVTLNMVPPPVETPLRTNRIIHCVERHKQKDEESARRVGMAVKSWLRLYSTGEVIPAHVWPPYPRNAKEIGDARELPYLKDILKAGMDRSQNIDDIIMITNDDTVLHPSVPEHVFGMLEKVPAVCSGRVNYERGEIPNWTETAIKRDARSWKGDIGKDLFAFRKVFLRKNWAHIPDFILGELEWDLVLSAWLRKKIGKEKTTNKSRESMIPIIELPMGCVMHEQHDRDWVRPENNEGKAKKHNTDLANKWYSENKMDHLILIR